MHNTIGASRVSYRGGGHVVGRGHLPEQGGGIENHQFGSKSYRGAPIFAFWGAVETDI